MNSKFSESLNKAISNKQQHLNEVDGYNVLTEMGIKTPKFTVVNSSSQVLGIDLSQFRGEEVVCKIISDKIIHKSEVGGVKIVGKSHKEIEIALKQMEANIPKEQVEGYCILEKIAFSKELGREMLLNIRYTDDLGPVLTFGTGGIYTELLSKSLKDDKSVAIFSLLNLDYKIIGQAISNLSIGPILVDGFRGSPPLTNISDLTKMFGNLKSFAQEYMPHPIKEVEINPLILDDEGVPMALDAMVSLGVEKPKPIIERPIQKIKNLLEPKSIAIVGVSQKMNMGHIILNNIIKCGFEKEKIYIIKPSTPEIEGCKCFDDIQSLPETVDLFILSISATDVPSTIIETIDNRKAHSMIVIPGGLEEKSGTESLLEKMHEAVATSHLSDWSGPVINGGNCLGIRSAPGKYDTLFLPAYKIPPLNVEDYSPVALISQSGAFLASKLDKLQNISPKYSISIGNQMDLTVGDYLAYLKDDPEIKLFAIYIEGFRPSDGEKFIKYAKEITQAGKTVLFYQAGRTQEGAKALSSHTASIAGNYTVNSTLAKQSSVIVAQTVQEFEELAITFHHLIDKEVTGKNVGCLSNAGFECVAMADNIGSLSFPKVGPPLHKKLLEVFKQCRIQDIVDVQNPLDITPMTNDEAYEYVIKAMLEDPDVDMGAFGIVPMAPLINTLVAGPHHNEDIKSVNSIAKRLIKLVKQTKKPFVVTIDGGRDYNQFAIDLEDSGIPVFRSVDTSLKCLNIFYQERNRINQLDATE